jgi:hypothetical protein
MEIARKSPSKQWPGCSSGHLAGRHDRGKVSSRCEEATAIHVPQQPQPSHAFGVFPDGDDVNRNHMHD